MSFSGAGHYFIDFLALGFALEAVASFARSDPWWKCLGLLAIGIIVFLIGIKWLWVVKNIATIPWRRWGVIGITSVLLVTIGAGFGARWIFRSRGTKSPDFIPITDPKDLLAIQKTVSGIYQAKAAYLESPEVFKLRFDKAKLRTDVEKVEVKYGCLFDLPTLQCFRKPPKVIYGTELEINVSTIVVSDEMSKSHFSVVRKAEHSKFRVPIVMFISLTNHHKKPIKIDLLYFEAELPSDKWGDVRMADSLASPPSIKTMDSTPLVLGPVDATGQMSGEQYGQMKGEYLLPSLYNKLIQPGDTVTGWIIAEYPKGVKYGTLIGNLRVSVLDSDKRWIASKIFPAHPPVYPNDDSGPIITGAVIHPLDFYIDEGQE